MKLELVKMPDQSVFYTYANDEAISVSIRVWFITINNVIVERIFEEQYESREEYDARLKNRVTVYEEALKVKAKKVRGI